MTIEEFLELVEGSGRLAKEATPGPWIPVAVAAETSKGKGHALGVGVAGNAESLDIIIKAGATKPADALLIADARGSVEIMAGALQVLTLSALDDPSAPIGDVMQAVCDAITESDPEE